MLLTPKETGGPCIFALRQHNCYLAIDSLPGSLILILWHLVQIVTRRRPFWRIQEFDIGQLAEALGQGAGETWQEHVSLILLACCGGKLFEWLDKKEETKNVR